MVKNLPAHAGDARNLNFIPGSGTSPRVGNGNPLQYSCLKNPVDRGAWCTIYTLKSHKESDTTEQLGAHTHTHTQNVTIKVLLHIRDISFSVYT